MLHLYLEEEPVELRRWKRVGARQVERILCCDDEKQVVEQVGLVVDRHLFLRHRFEHGRLHLWGGAVDLVGQDDVREHGAAPKCEAARFHVEDVCAGNVAWKQVRRELDATERGNAGGAVSFCERIAERAGKRRLAGARIVFEKHVAVGKQRYEHQFDHLVPTSNGCSQAGAQALRDLACATQAVIDGWLNRLLHLRSGL